MKPKTKQRFTIACVGLILSPPAAFVGGGLGSWACQFCKFGMRTPEMFGWLGIFLLLGLYALIAAAPALLIMLAFGVSRCTPPRKHAFLSIAVPFLLGGVSIILFCVPVESDLFNEPSALVVAGAVSIAVTAIGGLLTKQKPRDNKREATNRPKAAATAVGAGRPIHSGLGATDLQDENPYRSPSS
jgi:hypothetical protein